MTDIYVLELQHGKIYIGRSDNIKQRIANHFAGKGSSWTKAHPPIKVLQTMKSTSIFDEDKVVKEMMLKHGLDAVRGGSYSQCMLSEKARDVIEREILGATGKCFYCGQSGHFASGCKQKNLRSLKKKQDKLQVCKRCERKGHTADNCYYHKSKSGADLDDSLKPMKTIQKPSQQAGQQAGKSLARMLLGKLWSIL